MSARPHDIIAPARPAAARPCRGAEMLTVDGAAARVSARGRAGPRRRPRARWLAGACGREHSAAEMLWPSVARQQASRQQHDQPRAGARARHQARQVPAQTQQAHQARARGQGAEQLRGAQEARAEAAAAECGHVALQEEGGERAGAAAAGRDQHQLRQATGEDPAPWAHQRQVREAEEDRHLTRGN